jgi:hypothetical protein
MSKISRKITWLMNKIPLTVEQMSQVDEQVEPN